MAMENGSDRAGRLRARSLGPPGSTHPLQASSPAFSLLTRAEFLWGPLVRVTGLSEYSLVHGARGFMEQAGSLCGPGKGRRLQLFADASSPRRACSVEGSTARALVQRMVVA